MKMPFTIKAIFFLVLAIFLSCNRENKSVDDISTDNKTKLQEYNKNIPVSVSVSSVAQLIGRWVKLSQKDEAFIIYKPCAFQNPEIVISSDTLEIYWSSEVSKHLIDSIELKTNRKYSIYANGYIYQNSLIELDNHFKIDVEFLDEDSLAVFEWNMTWNDFLDEKNIEYSKCWLMTKASNSSNFLTIDNSCPDTRKREIPMEEIEFNKLKN